MPEPNVTPRVFISHSSKDNDFVRQLAEDLRAHNLTVWLDENELLPGDSIVNKISEGLKSIDYLIVVLSPASVQSKWVLEELNTGISMQLSNQGICVCPIVLEECEIPVLLHGRKHADFKGNYQAGLSQLLSSFNREAAKVQIMTQPVSGHSNQLWNVPHTRNPYFTGREDMLQRLHDALNTEGRTALTQTQAIHGLGGIGKTQTAVEYAYRYRDEYPNGVFWVVADNDLEIVTGYSAIATLLSLPEKDAQNPVDAAQAVMRWMEAESGWLLIFDNANTPALLKKFIPSYPKGHFLLTSRAHLFDMLNVPHPLELEALPPDSAVEFLFTRTDRQPDTQSEEERNAAARIADELGYLPLALEQAGAYIAEKNASFAAYLTSFRNRRLKVLEKRGPVTGSYPTSVAKTWTMNFEEVEKASEAAADVLRFSAFLSPDAIPLELLLMGAKEISPAVAEALADFQEDPLVMDELLEPLVRYSLIRRDNETLTYSIHRMLQEAMKAGMDDANLHHWSERIVRTLNKSFPAPEFGNWIVCDRLFSHATICDVIISTYHFELYEAGRLLLCMAYYMKERGFYKLAEPLYERAHVIWEKALGLDHPDVATSLNNLAGLYRGQGRYVEAKPLYERSLAIWEKALGPDHPDVATSLNNLAALYKQQGRYAEAKPLYERSLAIMEKALGPDHPHVASSLNNLAALYEAQSRYTEAEPLYERSLAIMEKALGPDHPDVATSLNNLAGLYKRQGRYVEAEPLFERALVIMVEALGTDHPSTFTVFTNYLMFLASADRKEIIGEVMDRHPALALRFFQQMAESATPQEGEET